ncbi:MAG: hypothetical protein IPK63_19905 [Candidatus Competibacteraceae bacterium]|nr:hypothetical protein [Candidatus Competibacteraceae bacterium]
MNVITPNIALKPTRFRYAPAVGLALRWSALRADHRGGVDRTGFVRREAPSIPPFERHSFAATPA